MWRIFVLTVALHADGDPGLSTAAMLRDLIRAASKKDMIVFLQFY
jgi:hypothetical protein